MTSLEYVALHVIHIGSLLGLIGAIFYASAKGPEQRKRALLWSGICAALVAATGARMSRAIYHGMPAWVWVKLACWLGLVALAGLIWRDRGRAGIWMATALVLAAVALVMVYLKLS